METAPPRATLVATVTTLPDGSFAPLASELEGIDWLEIRADLVGDLDAARLSRLFPGKLLYTLRSRAEGGGFEGSPERRRKRLIEAAARYDLVDLEALATTSRRTSSRRCRPRSGCSPGTGRPPSSTASRPPSSGWPPPRRPLQAGAHRRAAGRRDAAAAAARLARPPRRGRLRRRSPAAPGRAWWPPASARRWSTARSARCRARRGRSRSSACGATIGLPELPRIEALFGLVGNPVTHSLSPRIHNTAYRALGIPAVYLPFHAELLRRLLAGGGRERGAGGDRPAHPRALDDRAVQGGRRWRSPARRARWSSLIGAANTLVWNQGVWEAEATDPDGVVLPLRDRGLDIGAWRRRWSAPAAPGAVARRRGSTGPARG